MPRSPAAPAAGYGAEMCSVAFFFVDGVAKGLAFGEAAEVFLEDLVVARALGVGTSGDVGRDDHAVRFPERMAFRQRLGVRDVEAGAGEVATLERIGEDHGIVDLSARNADEECALFHFTE